MRTIRSLAVLTAVLGGLQLSLAAPGHADTLVSVTAQNLHLTADPGKANDVTIEPAGDDVQITDTGDVLRVQGSGCLTVTANTVRCPGPITVVNATLGDRDDRLVNKTGITTRVKGGTGKDTVDGGSGTDIFTGGPGDDVFTGNGGDDTFVADVLADGRDTFSGGPGTDLANYADRVNPLFVSLDGNADDGEGSEGDDMRADVENVLGGKVDDTVTGNDAANKLDGRGGTDTISGRGGDDDLIGGGGKDVLKGEGGDDRLRGVDGGFADTLNGGSDTDTCDADAADTEIDCEV
ncbi:Ca2+-binding RTX toxin-like protein [Streptosporangium becharense]|uniref:Ca2+-binding RTX toxin-like protein n=1 Tax=Streptosporangium becharense TaxID=1816182 RepID=A0A7W9IB50_9ACTN|nr:calcium-binding protein [Streptosporangium becharense]MBB2910790.1 Ca2+-binding RTX toxin-like protein [Streptosporangium becharense]MBB5817485.1 Ca2+-binding RTX toxin-like protein [Streptosporangium becharense]